jgi:hypothetical protein
MVEMKREVFGFSRGVAAIKEKEEAREPRITRIWEEEKEEASLFAD